MIYSLSIFFFFNDTATTEIYTLSLHDALPISLIDNPEITTEELLQYVQGPDFPTGGIIVGSEGIKAAYGTGHRSEEHTSELQSQSNLVCRLLLEKKKKESA